MHIEKCPSVKLSSESDACPTSNCTLALEEDFGSSSRSLGLRDESHPDPSEIAFRPCHPAVDRSLVYLNEETMDCNYAESISAPRRLDVTSMVASSPEMFAESDNEENEGKANFYELLPRLRDETESASDIDERKSARGTNEQSIENSDQYLLTRINKFLSGVPPPPKHTICQLDSLDLLARVYNNRNYFFFDPFDDQEKKDVTINDDEARGTTHDSKVMAFEIHDKMSAMNDKNNSSEKLESCEQKFVNVSNYGNHRGRGSLRNLNAAFDACDCTNGKTTKDDAPESPASRSTDYHCDNTEKNLTTVRDISPLLNDSSMSAASQIITNRDQERAKRVTFDIPEDERIRFWSTIKVDDIKDMPWELAYKHKTHGIHYNRSKTVEQFEDLTMKLCQRYVGAETQSSCNIWFTKQAPGSVKKRNLLARRNNGQSPGKRLSHLARRRRTFSSANLQILGQVDKKQLVLNIKKPTIRRGKSPRGKSPRGSAKKRSGLSRISPSPRKARLEMSKRALFQSPPGERAGPSGGTAVSLVNGTNPQQRIKRALFSTPITAPLGIADAKRALTFEESRKRKSDEDLEGPGCKWAKTLSFDNAHITDSNSTDSWNSEKNTTGDHYMKNETSLQHGRKLELSETHRKKLLWAVAEALRNRGIGIGHPRFKHCATQLARIVKKYMPDLDNPSIPRKPGSTSDRMLRLAKRHVLLIVETKSTD